MAGWARQGGRLNRAGGLGCAMQGGAPGAGIDGMALPQCRQHHQSSQSLLPSPRRRQGGEGACCIVHSEAMRANEARPTRRSAHLLSGVVWGRCWERWSSCTSLPHQTADTFTTTGLRGFNRRLLAKKAPAMLLKSAGPSSCTAQHSTAQHDRTGQQAGKEGGRGARSECAAAHAPCGLQASTCPTQPEPSYAASALPTGTRQPPLAQFLLCPPSARRHARTPPAHPP